MKKKTTIGHSKAVVLALFIPCGVLWLLAITKTCLYNFDPLESHFYTAKLGFTGIYIIFLISAQKHRLWVLVRTASALKNIDCGYPLEPPRRGGSNGYPQSMF